MASLKKKLSNLVIYKRTNIKKNLVYIGQCSRPGDPRWNECLYVARKGGGFRLGKAIREDGEETFIREIIYRAKTQQELNMMETFFITLHQANDPRYGYNMNLGGFGGGPNCAKGRIGLPSPKKGLTAEEYYGAEKAKRIAKKLADLNTGTKKGIWVTNGVKNKVVDENEIPDGYYPGRKDKKHKPSSVLLSKEFLDKRGISIKAGWAKRLESNPEEKVWINDGVELKRVPKSFSLPKGWFYGRGKLVKKSDKPVYQKGTVWITNDRESKMVPKDFILPEGWSYGRCYRRHSFT